MSRIEVMPQDAARQLWRAGFPEDTDAFFESYRDLRSEPSLTLALYDDDMWCAGLHIIPQTLCIRGAEISAGFVAGVATEPSKRKRGYAGDLMRKAAEVLLEKGISLAVLDPFRESFYEPFGYRTGTVYRDFICSEAEEADVYTTCDVEKLDRLYRRFMKDFSGYVVRNDRDWAFRLRDAQLEEGFVFCLIDDSAYAIVSEEEENIRVWEVLGETEVSVQKLLRVLCHRFGKEVHYSLPAKLTDSDTRHGAMYCPLDLDALIEKIPAADKSVAYQAAQVMDAGELFLILLGARDARDIKALDRQTAESLSRKYPVCKTLLFEQY